MKVSIIIPFHNEEKTLPIVIRELKKIQVKDVTFECLFVNDGSTDNSEHLVKKSLSSSKRKQDILLTLKKNEGKGSAIKKGIRKATGEYILIQDADMEYHPRYIPKLLQPIIDKMAEVVFGTRLQTIPKFSGELRRPRFVLHYVGNRMLSLITSMLFGAWITDMETGYKVFPKKAFAQKTLSANKFDIEPEITAKLLKSGYKIREVPITTEPRGYSAGKKLRTLPDGIAALNTLFRMRFYD